MPPVNCGSPLPGSAAGPSSAGRPRSPAAAGQGRAPERLENACRELEALFVSYLFKSMRASIPEAGLLDGGHAEDLYTAMLDEELARQMSQQRSLGLGAMLRRQLQPDPPPAAAATGAAPKGFAGTDR